VFRRQRLAIHPPGDEYIAFNARERKILCVTINCNAAEVFEIRTLRPDISGFPLWTAVSEYIRKPHTRPDDVAYTPRWL
jgi:hypothetical protein